MQKQTLSRADLLRMLEEIWIGERSGDSLELLDVGNALVLAYFFPPDGKIDPKFADFSLDLLERAGEIEKALAQRREFVDMARLQSIVQQTQLMQVHYYRSLDEKKADRILEELVACFRKTSSRFRPCVTTDFPDSVPRALLGFFDTYVADKLEKSVLDDRPGKKSADKWTPDPQTPEAQTEN